MSEDHDIEDLLRCHQLGTEVDAIAVPKLERYDCDVKVLLECPSCSATFCDRNGEPGTGKSDR